MLIAQKTRYCYYDNFLLIYLQFQCNIKIPTGFYFVEINKLILKFTWKSHRTRITKIILKKNKLQDSHHLTYFKAAIIKTMCYSQEDRHKGQQDRTESSEIHLTHNMVNQFLTMMSKQFRREIFIFSKNCAETIGYLYPK